MRPNLPEPDEALLTTLRDVFAAVFAARPTGAAPAVPRLDHRKRMAALNPQPQKISRYRSKLTNLA